MKKSFTSASMGWLHSLIWAETQEKEESRSLQFLCDSPDSWSTRWVFSVTPKHYTEFKKCFLLLIVLCIYEDFSEKLLKQLEDSKERFEVKIMMMELISRLVGIHEVSLSITRSCLKSVSQIKSDHLSLLFQLFLFNFYPFIQRFLQPHQRGKTTH